MFECILDGGDGVDVYEGWVDVCGVLLYEVSEWGEVVFFYCFVVGDDE